MIKKPLEKDSRETVSLLWVILKNSTISLNPISGDADDCQKRIEHCSRIFSLLTPGPASLFRNRGYAIIFLERRKKENDSIVEDQANNTQQCKTERCIEHERQQ